jgi:septal ring factor EnvC (AmiA/AmiB activator)
MATERETRASINDALKKEHANLKKESERLKSNIERSKREIDALREQNARLSRTLARYQREGLELKREERRVTLRREEERRETEYAEVLRDAFDVNPLENGERENPSQVLRRVYREMMVEECDRDIEEALKRELEREKN